MLIAYQVAIDLVRDLRPIVERVRKHDSTLAKQLVDAMSSTVQNLAEAEVHRGGNKRAKLDIAFGEANEVKASLDLAMGTRRRRQPAGDHSADEAGPLARTVLGPHARQGCVVSTPHA